MRLLILLVTWSFEKDEVDKPPAGFEFTTTRKTPAGKWVVKQDGDNKVLAQIDTTADDGRFAMAVVSDSNYKDLVLSVRGKPMSGTLDQAVGLVWRYQDADNYYLARFNALEGNLRLYHVVKGKRVQFNGKEDLHLKTGEWRTLKIEHQGDAVKVYLDNEKMFESADKTFQGAGKIGVWVKSDSVTYFDDLTVEELK
jgi:hypothetical protein